MGSVFRPARSGAFLSATAFALVGTLYSSAAHADYFTMAFAGSPLGAALYGFGTTNGSTVLSADAAMIFSNGSATVTANGSATADLSQGLAATAGGNIGYAGPASYNGTTLVDSSGNYYSLGNAALGDTLTFLGNFTGQTATITASIGGSWTSTGTQNILSQSFSFLAFTPGTIAANAADEFNLFDGTYTGGTALQQDNVNTLASTFPSTVTLAITLNGLDPSIDLAADLDLYVTENYQGVGNSFNANFGDGVTFTINAPPGVIVTSDSGVFPDTAATPLPAALPLFATGLGGLGLLGWRRKRKAAALAT